MNDINFDPVLFAELYDVQPQAIIWQRPVWTGNDITDFEFVYCNEKGLKFLEMSAEQVKGLRVSLSPSLTIEQRNQFMQEMIKVYHTGISSESNIYNPALDKYACVLRTKLRGGILTIIQDNTRENHMIRELEQQKRLMDNLLKLSPAGISITEVIRDQAGRVVDGRSILANDLGIAFTGLPKEVALSRTILQVDPAMLDSPLYQMALNTLASGEPFHTEYYFAPSGRWLELSVSRMDENHLINVFMDITEVKQAQLQLEKTVDELRRSNSSLEEFAHAASHDLKEPMRKLHVFADRLALSLNSRLTDLERSLFDRMKAALDRMTLLVDDLLSYSILGSSPLKMEQIDLSEKLNLVLSDMEVAIEEKKARFHIAPLPAIKGFKRQLAQLFQNLISNSLKYSRPEAPPEITITSSLIKGAAAPINLPGHDHEKTFAMIMIEDNGIGFDQEYAEKIFQMFHRLHGRSEYPGTGIGLSIARKVVENHKGYIWAKSAPGKGARFYLLLPQNKETSEISQ